MQHFSGHDNSHLDGDLRREVAEGLFYTHFRLSQTTNKNRETSAFLYGLIELLSEKGLITVQELDERKKVVAERVIAQLEEKGLEVILQDVVRGRSLGGQVEAVTLGSEREVVYRILEASHERAS